MPAAGPVDRVLQHRPQDARGGHSARGTSGNLPERRPSTSRLSVMGMTVWVDSWQVQCCGEPFHRGSQVAWTLGPADTVWLEEILSPHARQPVDAAEEHHGGLPEDAQATVGTVTGIAAVHCRFESSPGGGPPAFCAVRGSGVLTDIERADGWTLDRGEERFVGYLVRLDVDSGRCGRCEAQPMRSANETMIPSGPRT